MSFKLKLLKVDPNSIIEGQKLLLKIEDLILQFKDSISLYESILDKESLKDDGEKIDLSSILKDFNKKFFKF